MRRENQRVMWPPPENGEKRNKRGHEPSRVDGRRVLAISGILACLAILAIGVWWWIAPQQEPSPYKVPEKQGKTVMPKEVTPALTNSDTNLVSGVTESTVPEWAEKTVITPSGPKKVRVGYTKAVQAALRSSNEPIQSFVKPIDPNSPPPPPPRYKNDLQSQLSEFAWSGQFVGVPDPMTDKEARKMLEEPIEILASDTEEVAAEKQTVMAMQKELKEYLDNGGHADDYFMELMKRQDAEAETVREAKSQIRDLYKSGDIELGDQALVKFNEYLKSKGLPAIKETPLMKRYRKQAMEVQAQEKR